MDYIISIEKDTADKRVIEINSMFVAAKLQKMATSGDYSKLIHVGVDSVKAYKVNTVNQLEEIGGIEY